MSTKLKLGMLGHRRITEDELQLELFKLECGNEPGLAGCFEGKHRITPQEGRGCSLCELLPSALTQH